MNYPQVNADTAGAELNRLHAEIETKLHSTVQDAIRAGEILAQIKGRVGHGNFLAWVKGNCSFSERTARNYLGVYDHRDKTASVADLQTAYTRIETLEAQARKSEEEQAQHRVGIFLKSGTKLEGWRRGTDDKLAQDERIRRGRIAQAQEELRREHEERISQDQGDNARRESLHQETSRLIDEALRSASAAVERTTARQSWKEKIRVSHEGMTDPFSDALLDYLEGLDSDSRKIEACYNLIKICKRIATDLQTQGAPA